MFLDISTDYDLERSTEFVADENASVGGTVQLYGYKFKENMSSDTTGAYFNFSYFSHLESE